MKNGTSRSTGVISILIFLALIPFSGSAFAFNQWSQNGGDQTNCGACHGNFRNNLYISLTDGMLWGNLHNIHRQDMLNGDCDVCHSGGDSFPVLLNTSNGGSGLDPISCVGCHGRAEDDSPENPSDLPGYGAGLRQHHFDAGVDLCANCHADADPLNFTVSPERTLPPYYANPGNNHPNMPNDPCNPDGNEDFAGIAEGLDNDGDGPYDGDDVDCSAESVIEPATYAGLHIQNHPNPFKPETVIQYTLTDPGPVSLRIYSINGELIRTLVDDVHDRADTYAIRWNGIDDSGRAVASGVYLARLESSGRVETKRMILAQ